MVDNALSVNDSVDYEYDIWNRLVRESRYLSGQEYTVEYHYDEGNRISGLLYPDGTEILYEYDDFSRIIQVTQYIDGVQDEVIMNNVQYDTEGLLTQTEYGNGLTGTYSYNQSGMVSHINLNSGDTDYLNLQYTYDANNNITEQIQGWRNTHSTWNTDTVSYSYDGLDRLTSASCTAWSHTYAYDKAGNRIQKDGITSTVNVLNQVTSLSDGTVLAYDLNGNTIEKTTDTDTVTYFYDHAHRLDTVKKNGVTIGQYWYDGDGKRIKSAESTETIYIYSGLNVLYEKTSTGEAVYIYGPTGKIAKKTITEQESHTFYYHPDHQGSTRLVTDESANVVVDAAYTPFGESTKTGTESYLYTGKKKDETGLYYYGARYYDPELGRFLTRDLLAGQKALPQSLNRYTYCLNNPVKFIDPAGLTYRMCNVETGACYRFFEWMNPKNKGLSWVAYDANGDKITDNIEIENLLDPTGKTKKEIKADQAKAAYLMLLVTHPEIEGDPDQAGIFKEEAGAYEFIVRVDGEEVKLWIVISEDWMSNKEEPGRMLETFQFTGNGKKEKLMLITLYQWAFKSVFHLYHVMGHEGQHLVDLVRTGTTNEESAFAWNKSHDYAPPYYIPFPFDRKKYRQLPRMPR
jgi:RHS repeat-associated protein